MNIPHQLISFFKFKRNKRKAFKFKQEEEEKENGGNEKLRKKNYEY